MDGNGAITRIVLCLAVLALRTDSTNAQCTDAPGFACDQVLCDAMCGCPSAASNGFLDDWLAEALPGAASVFSQDVLYTTDAFRNTYGGNQTGGVYKGLVDVVLRTDLSAIGMDRVGGDVVLHGLNSHGGFLAPLVGGTQSTNIDADDFTAMGEFYWERYAADGNIVTRIGRQVGAIQFSVLDPAADFLWGGFIISPNNPLPWYPNPTIGITSNVQLTETFDLGMGVFNGGAPNQMSPWGWSRDGSVYSIMELTHSYSIGGRPGDIQNGVWYTSANQADSFGGPAHRDSYGYYFGADQMLFAENGDPTQGLAAFFIYSYAPEERSAINHHYASGLVYRGLLPRRDGDVFGMGLSNVDFSNPATNPERETVIETFYKAHLCGSFFVQPAIQFIDNPSGTLDDSLVAGARIGFEL